MKTYLELNEILTPEEALIQQPLQVRVEVADKDDALAKLPLYEPDFEGRTYTKKIHYCYHEEGLPCKLEDL